MVSLSLATGTAAQRLNRFELTSLLVSRLTKDEAIVAGIGNTNFDLWATGRRPQNFYMLGSMGLALPIALGVALAQPDRHVVAIEGDGSLLMQLGCLATIARQAPPNLTLIVMDNGAYQITGSQPTATHFGADIVGIARSCGLTDSDWAADEEQFVAQLELALAGGRTRLIAAKVDGEAGRGSTDRDPSWIRDSFMRGLGTRA